MAKAMSTSGNYYYDNHYYNPKAEAKALGWNNLCPSTQRALEKIVCWLEAACDRNEKRADSEQEKLALQYEAPSTSILVSGDRGAGKTTVLLTAAYAFRLAAEQNGDFFPPTVYSGLDLKQKLRNICKKVSWLDTLDLEPLHPNSNLLAAMLVRIRLALERLDIEYGDDDYFRHGSHHHSILESNLGTGERLDRLINEATFMWESQPNSGVPRPEQSEQQIKSAEIYARFNTDFRAVMENAVELVKKRGTQTEIFVLPIDNVDRSIDHIANISKLIRMATSRRLWFLLAAVRPDYQLFLERSFQNELLRSGMGINSSNWDQTQAIARRQAATSLRRSLPENYQIRIAPLEAKIAWKYLNSHEWDNVTQHEAKHSLSGVTEKFDSVEDFCDLVNSCKQREMSDTSKNATVGSVKLENEKNLLGKEKLGANRISTFEDLFNITNQLDEKTKNEYIAAKKNGKQQDKNTQGILVFTGSGKMALKLSMRTLLDLKAAILRYGKRYDYSIETAVEVSVKMLRNAIDESDLPFWASKQLLDRIIRKNSEGNWVLDLTDDPVKPFRQPPHFNKIPASAALRGEKNNSTVHIGEQKFRYQESPDLVLEIRDTTPDNTRDSKHYPLPPVIAGWFMILFDTLVLSVGHRILSKRYLPNDVFSSVIVASHKLIYKNCGSVDMSFEWKTPEWPTFTEHFLFATQWTAILKKLKDTFPGEPKKGDISENMLKYLRLAFIENVLSVSGKIDNNSKRLKILSVTNADGDTKRKKQQLDQCAEHIGSMLSTDVTWDESEYRKRVINKWLSAELPLLLLPEYFPYRKPNEKENDYWNISWIPKYRKGDWRNNYETLNLLLIDRVRSSIENGLSQGSALYAPADKDKIMNDWFSIAGYLS